VLVDSTSAVTHLTCVFCMFGERLPSCTIKPVFSCALYFVNFAILASSRK